MKKTTLTDIAHEAGVGVATVDRVLNRRAPVRPDTEKRVVQAATRLGYRFDPEFLPQDTPLRRSGTLRIGVILLSRDYSFYDTFSRALEKQAAPYLQEGTGIEFAFHGIHAIEQTAAAIEQLSNRVNMLALIALDNALIRRAVEQAVKKGVKVFTILSDLSPCGHAGYIGLDNRKAGRTAAWAVQRLSGPPGKVGVIVGDNRFLCQETCEISFRSYLREFATGHRVLEPVKSFENVEQGYQVTAELIRNHPELSVIYAPCGGVEGVVNALRDSSRRQEITLICHGPLQDAQLALIDGTLDIMIAHRLDELAARVIEAMQLAHRQESGSFITLTSGFELITKENY
ncbi:MULTISPECIES: LacI family DNA-binding transcriptional regulator [Erwinia]|uniref:LacI family DNA-binding transcriptional regulator n=1 Tax=Erwinia TaxID=551 RepID=UPI000789F186|nr:LacI family DNA-binding transcriptional regulator [Erwinia sp. V90_4]KYP87854.1 LacI family transcriptional regulator [bacteria symbiont BFo1 of Frankliniella occidentalis]MDI3442255.1 LacI family DNA-binding transcriptional regulator [Erwinia sp. V90_4]